MRSVFDPLELTVDASLNLEIIGDFGCPAIVGLPAEDVCSRDALSSLARGHGLAGFEQHRLADALASAAGSADPSQSRAARTTLLTFGRRLGALISTLRSPPRPEVRRTNTSVRRAYLAHWLTVDSISLAGGLLSGGAGHMILGGVQEGATRAAHPCDVALVPYPGLAPLIGAARRLPREASSSVVAVADLGHTSMRTAIAERPDGVLTRLRLLDSRSAPPRRRVAEVEGAVEDALLGVVKRLVAHGCRRVPLVVSLASYVEAGRPVDDGQGLYGTLHDRVTSIQNNLADRSGAEVCLQVVHDGTAAACSVDSGNSATITVGTWLGVGFQLASQMQLSRLAPDLRIDRL